jgi:hypothetical protein
MEKANTPICILYIIVAIPLHSMNALHFQSGRQNKEASAPPTLTVNIWSWKLHHWYNGTLKFNTLKIIFAYSLQIS